MRVARLSAILLSNPKSRTRLKGALCRIFDHLDVQLRRIIASFNGQVHLVLTLLHRQCGLCRLNHHMTCLFHVLVRYVGESTRFSFKTNENFRVHLQVDMTVVDLTICIIVMNRQSCLLLDLDTTYWYTEVKPDNLNCHRELFCIFF